MKSIQKTAKCQLNGNLPAKGHLDQACVGVYPLSKRGL